MIKLVVALALLSFGSCQEKKSNHAGISSASESEDHFVGVWKLNRLKSTRDNPMFPKGGFLPVYELITIDREGSNFRLSYRLSAHKSGKEDSVLVTGMNGAVHDPVAEGKPELGGGWYITRKNATGFFEVSSVSQIEYTVSPDSQTMTVRQRADVDNDFEHILLYERVR